ncbi:uncharacterized protein A4U43_C02F16690 [Asparagus officinalis]|uniref:Uncharacterized protein n=1 Tax=Asparagus officinalis TaxID=4686 RepID=A0A5P1FLJ6_ASPOF|nr:uncharacterized protein A4U43_C02F16690 [Asparagus officinalis]
MFMNHIMAFHHFYGSLSRTYFRHGITKYELKEGKWQVRRICNEVFNQWPKKDKGLLALKDLHIVTLMVCNSVNKQFLSPYKEPPSMEAAQNKVKACMFSLASSQSISIDQKNYVRHRARVVALFLSEERAFESGATLKV